MIIITGDFNLNMQNVQSARKITSLCEQLSLVQFIGEPTHFTETSSSLIDLLLVNNNEHLILSGVVDPFLHQDIRYHCPVLEFLTFANPSVYLLNVAYGNMMMVIMKCQGKKHQLPTGTTFKTMILTHTAKI